MSPLFILLLWSNFALVFVMGKHVLSSFNFLDFVALRMLIAGPILIGWDIVFNLKREGLRRITLDSSWLFLLVSILLMFIPFVLEYWAQQFLTAAKVSLLHSFSPSITALLSLLLLKDQITKNKIVGLALSFLAINLAFSGGVELGGWRTLSIHDLAMLMAVSSSCLGWILVEKLLTIGYSSRYINGVSMLIGGLGTVLVKIIIDPSWLTSLSYLKDVTLLSWGVFFLILLLSNFIGYPLYGWLLTSYSPTLVSLSGFLCPILTALFGYVLLGEQIRWISLGLSIMLGSLGLLIFRKRAALAD